MVNPSVTYDRFLATFVPGAIVTFGAFYLHRPFLLKYFPYVAGDPSESAAIIVSAEWRTIIFSVAAVCIGVTVNQMSDIAIVALVTGEEKIDRPSKGHRKMARVLIKAFSFKSLPDCRRHIVERYMESDRSGQFLAMVKDWANSDREKLQKFGEPAIVHQHLVSRLRVISEHSNQILKEMYASLEFASSLFISSALLFALALLAPLSANMVQSSFKVHLVSVYVTLVALVYLLSLITCYNLRRRISIFFSRVITLALHFYQAGQSKSAEG